jgi:hypothetical protein
MDALSHAIESYVATLASDFTRPLSVAATNMVFKYLRRAYSNGKDREARKKIAYAQCLAGIAFTNAVLGLIHSMSHKIGAQFNIPHGCANAILFPYVIQYNRLAAEDGYAKLASHIGIREECPRRATEELVTEIKKLNKDLSIPQTIRGFGVEEKVFMERLDETSKNAFDDPPTGTNPRVSSVEDIRRIYLCAFEGEEVTF